MNLSQLTIYDFYEKNIDNKTWFYFKIDEVQYYLFFIEYANGQSIYLNYGIRHFKGTCHYCDCKRGECCDFLSEYVENFYFYLNSFSKNRIRRLTKTIEKN